jgi:hypothetical protein
VQLNQGFLRRKGQVPSFRSQCAAHSYWRKSRETEAGKPTSYYGFELSADNLFDGADRRTSQLPTGELMFRERLGQFGRPCEQRSPFSGYFTQGYRAQRFRRPLSLPRLGSIETVAVGFEFLRPLACSESANGVRGADRSLAKDWVVFEFLRSKGHFSPGSLYAYGCGRIISASSVILTGREVGTPRSVAWLGSGDWTRSREFHHSAFSVAICKRSPFSGLGVALNSWDSMPRLRVRRQVWYALTRKDPRVGPHGGLELHRLITIRRCN